jgi:hypothetical protein
MYQCTPTFQGKQKFWNTHAEVGRIVLGHCKRSLALQEETEFQNFSIFPLRFIESESLLPGSQKSTTGPYPKPDEISQYFLNIYF